MSQKIRGERYAAYRKAIEVRSTLNDVFFRFRDNINRQISPTTNHLNYIQRYERFVMPEFGEKELDQIFPSDMDTLYKNILALYSESQAFHVCNVVRYLYNRAREWHMFSGDIPMGRGKGFVLKQPTKKRELVYTPEEVKTIMSRLKARSKQTHDMVLLSFCTGARFGSITKIQERHVDLVEGRINLIDMKNGKDMHVFIPQVCIDMIKEIWTGNPDKHLFVNAKGEKVEWLSKTFDRVIDDLGINDGVTDSRFKRKFHTLRHSFATHVLHECKDISLGELKEMMGHSSLKTTERYLHANKRAMKNAVNSIGESL